MDWPLRFGIFLAPFHPAGQNPTLAIERDLELIVRLDELGYNEAWIGEHHSAGFEIIASPEVFIAAAAQRTKNIRLGTGVSSLPYHHPLILADRMVLLDHLTRGRVMFGVGPGALPSDAFMMGIDPARQREMMEESLEAIIALLTDDEPVNMVTDWFTLKDARLQLRPYTHPRFEIGVAAQISPAGPRAAGRFGVALLSLGATTAGGFDVLGAHWQTAEERAAQFGTSVDRRTWRLVGPMHIRETEEQAHADVEYGLADWVKYFQEVAALPIAPNTDDHSTILDAMNASGIAVIGTPEMAIAQIQRLIEQSGGFGTYLFMAHEWADRQATLASYELFAREVMPVFQQAAERAVRSRNWAAENRPEFMNAAFTAVGKAITDHQAEKELRNQAGPEEAGRAETAGTAGTTG
jgi:limonene 1,2-monooxygenase